jgi:polyisoprenoid-binding protein YceI
MRGVSILCGGLLFGATAASAECRWSMVKDASAITFTATMQGAEFQGRFGDFDADIVFDPADPARGLVKVTVVLASVDTQFAERDEELRKPDWFDVVQFPIATYEASTFTRTADRSYAATGTLNLRGRTVPVPLEFVLMVDGDTAEAKGTARINRLDFGLGWPGTEVVGGDIGIQVAVTARRADGATCSP